MFTNDRVCMVSRSAANLVLFALTLTTLSLAANPMSVTWMKLHPNVGFPARSGFATAYDPISKKVVVFGGNDSTGQLNDTWTFDGTTWTQIVTSMAPGNRADATMAYDVESHELVLFGGFEGVTMLNDTWLWDGAISTWTQAQPTNIPKPATNPILFTDPANGHTDMFGGYQGQFFSRSMYQWTGTDWLTIYPSTTPYPRSGAIVAYDPIRKNIVLFGGLS